MSTTGQTLSPHTKKIQFHVFTIQTTIISRWSFVICKELSFLRSMRVTILPWQPFR